MKKKPKSNSPIISHKHTTLFMLNILIIALAVVGIRLLGKSTVIEVGASALNVRTGPGVNYGIQTQVKKGVKVSVMKKDKEWYKVLLPDGKTGWVASWLVEDAKTTPVTNILATVNTAETKLRKKPGIDEEILKVLKKDTPVEITLEQDGWSQVKVDNQVGWISSNLLNIKTENKTTTKKANKDSNEQDKFLYTRDMSTNVREKPNLTAPLVTTLKQNTKVTILKQEDDWYQIKTSDNEIGYVASWVMTKEEDENLNGLNTAIAETTIMLDAGHGGKDGGASKNNVYEKDLTLSTVLLLKKSLEKLGARVILTREDDTFVDLIPRSDLSNKEKPDAFISIHYDATEQANIATGTHTYYYHPQDKKLAEIVSQHLSDLPLKNNGFATKNLSVTRENTQPALLLELGYMSTNNDVSYIITEDYQQQAANAITSALVEYFQ